MGRLAVQAISLTLCITTAVSGSSYEAVVGTLRVQALSPTLVRVEHRGALGFEDRNTFTVTNRQSFTGVSIVNRSVLADGRTRLATLHYAVYIRPPLSPPPSPASTCAHPTTGVDGSMQSQRIKNNPQRMNMSVATCCAACDAEPECVAWVMNHASCPVETCTCWLLKSFFPESANDRISGGQPSVGNSGTVEVYAVSSTGVESTAPLFPRTILEDVSPSLAFPTPVSMYEKAVKGWAIRDGPRFIPSPEGAIPCADEGRIAKCNPALLNTSGFDLRNDAADVYIFLPGAINNYEYKDLRKEYLLLTGEIPAIPDEAFGTWFSWYHAYTQEEVSADIARWRKDDLPIDIWGLDMDWRVWRNGMEGREYAINTTLFPNMSAFYDYAHAMDLVVYMNDHPMPKATQLSPEEIKFRYDGLTSLFDIGLDFWWYDENWHNIIPGLDNFTNGDRVDHLIWGQEIFRTVEAHYNGKNGPRNASRPDMAARPLTLSMYSSSHPAEHRFPVWWTGDVIYTQLLDNVQKMVNGGLSLQPYVHPDCGAHYGIPFKQETPEMFVRWAQFCSMGTIVRFHTNNCCDHRPWSWGKAAEDAIRKTLKIRYTLMPTLISAGRAATADGTPIVKRLDLEWPELSAAGASRDDQYLLAHDILIAPVIPFNSTGPITNGPGNTSRSVWVPPGSWADAWSSKVVLGPQLIHVKDVPLDQIPTWHRKGSLLVTTLPMGSTAAQDWSSADDPLTIEVFPFARDGATRTPTVTSRIFYDTKAKALEPPRVILTLEQTRKAGAVSAHSLALRIGGGPARVWRVRVHLLPGETISSVDSIVFTNATPISDGFAAIERHDTVAPHSGRSGADRNVADVTVSLGENENRELLFDLVFGPYPVV